jgi:inhibitor of KinA
LNPPVDIFALGDSAATIELGNSIDRELNAKSRNMKDWLLAHPFEGMQDVIGAYSSVSIFYDPVTVMEKMRPNGGAFDFVRQRLFEALNNSASGSTAEKDEIVRIPVCYDDAFGPDLDMVSQTNHLSKQSIIDLHVSKLYYVYMIGFLPGFSYMAEVDEKLFMPRKKVPVNVAAGSVGIAGGQTGLYPFSCPGGWQIIGRTPVPLFNPNQQVPVVLESGDLVEFYAITKEEFVYGNGQVSRITKKEKDG